MSEALSLPQGITLDALMRLTAVEVLTTYGPDVSNLVSRLQASGIVPRDGRSNQDLVVQAQMREIIARDGDCEPADSYRAELEAQAEKRMAEEEQET